MDDDIKMIDKAEFQANLRVLRAQARARQKLSILERGELQSLAKRLYNELVDDVIPIVDGKVMVDADDEAVTLVPRHVVIID